VSEWLSLPSDAPDLFDRLRSAGAAQISVRFGIGTEGGHRVEIPAVRLVLTGQLQVEARQDRFGVLVPGWGEGDFAWFARRKGRGGPDYWQGAVEHRPEGLPALVVYFTAPLDGLEIRLRPVGQPQMDANREAELQMNAEERRC
jgi:hypothetical protein